MATISFRVSEEEKNNITISELMLNSVLEKIADTEDYMLEEK